MSAVLKSLNPGVCNHRYPQPQRLETRIKLATSHDELELFNGMLCDIDGHC